MYMNWGKVIVQSAIAQLYALQDCDRPDVSPHCAQWAAQAQETIDAWPDEE